MICGESIGLVGIEGFQEIDGETGKVRDILPLRYPFRGSMVGSPDAFHSIPAPFAPEIDFEFARCPYGRIHRPMVLDDAVLTHKGLVRLPKDGSPAYLDKTASTEVDRHSIGDRVIQVPDDVAERMAREALDPKVFVSDEVPKDTIFVMDKDTKIEFVPPTLETRSPPFVCPVCDKVFETKRQLQGHMMSHKKAKGRGKK
ncbi:MAG: C2H2-type zinc finger protein [Pseudomonadota bacterium]